MRARGLAELLGTAVARTALVGAALAGTALAGCRFDPPEHAARGDGGTDPTSDAPGVACTPWDALNVNPCDPALPAPAPITLAPGTHLIDTDRGSIASNGGAAVPLSSGLVAQLQGGPMVRAVNARSLTVEAGATVALVGSSPIVFVVHEDAAILGTLDASARGVPPAPGAGGNDASQCASGTGAPGKASTGAGGGGGGGGGAYGGDGGDGGDGQGGGHGNKGAMGMKGGAPGLAPLRAGCRGGAGGDDAVVAGDQGGLAGEGGGALEITARGTIEVVGQLTANGGPGSGVVQAAAGGGGGGSGGAIVLDGRAIRIGATAALCANGGGGGEGGQDVETSSSGTLPTCVVDRARGGATIDDGGDGGAGGAGPDVDATDGRAGTNEGGGGGGGGGVGRIRVRSREQGARVDDGAVISPGRSPGLR